jgi:hypothetical protein
MQFRNWISPLVAPMCFATDCESLGVEELTFMDCF